MVFAKNILASILALLLANPACCCALTGCGSSDASMPEVPTRSCCCSSSESSDSQDKQSPDKENHNCRCSFNKRVLDNSKIDFSYHSVALIPEPREITLLVDVSVPSAELPLDVRYACHHPPNTPVRILFSTFQL